MKKRGGSELIATILLIVIVLIILAIVIAFLFRNFAENEEIIIIQGELSKEELDISNLDFKDDQNMTLTLEKGPDAQILVNISQEERHYEYNITVKRNRTDYIPHTETLNGSQADIVIVSDVSRSMDPSFGQGDKIGESKQATKDFINITLNGTENNISLVAYQYSVIPTWGHGLSNDPDSLDNIVDLWDAVGGTCICCGVNKGIEYLSDSERIKVMIVMTDGEANRQCSQQGTGNAKTDAIEAAREAFEGYNITVYTVGFGTSGIDITTLQSMASAGNGSYYGADVGELNEIYSNISGEIIVYDEVNITWYEPNVTEYDEIVTIKEYNASTVYSYLRVIFYTDSKTYQKIIHASEVPAPHEEREINLSLDESWPITTNDLTKIEIYAAILLENGDEVLSSSPIATWGGTGLYSQGK